MSDISGRLIYKDTLCLPEPVFCGVKCLLNVGTNLVSNLGYTLNVNEFFSISKVTNGLFNA